MSDYLQRVKELADKEGYSYCNVCMYAGGVCPAPNSCELFDNTGKATSEETRSP